MPDFQLVSDFEPSGDQPKAIAELTAGVRGGRVGSVAAADPLEVLCFFSSVAAMESTVVVDAGPIGCSARV